MTEKYEWVKVVARQKLNLGSLPGIPKGINVLLRPGEESQPIPRCDIVNFYIEHKSLEVIEEDIANPYGDEPEPETKSPSEDGPVADEPGYPRHVGGYWYELSDGRKVQGKEKAIEAEELLWQKA
ncbi:MAG: hypothetical protein PHZ19_11935 [Candidatus Thermoplasmatota archaeon]|nr:hypothetical protein [Candidatus Thermoplasmatota archaeon]